jgi:hypothetical protein
MTSRVRHRAVAAIESAQKGQEMHVLIDSYLNLEHCNDVAEGCPMAALSSEIARRPKPSREPFLQALRAHVRRMEQYMPGATVEERRQRTIALLTVQSARRRMAAGPTGQRGSDPMT